MRVECYIYLNYHISMKKILFRKLLWDCLKFFFISIFGISLIVWVFQAVNYLDIMVEDGRNYLVYFQYTILNFPKIIGKIFPFAMFLSFFYIILKYESNNELLILWSHGVSKLQVINFFLKISLVFMIFQIIFLTFVVPKTINLSKSTIRNSDVNFFDSILKAKKFNDTIKGVTIYTEKKQTENELGNIFIKKGNDEILFAKKGAIINQSNLQVLVLFNGQNIIGKDNKLNSFTFSKSNFNLTNLVPKANTYRKIQEIESIDLIRCFISIKNRKEGNSEVFNIENCSISDFSPKSILFDIQRELYKRVIIPLYIPLLIISSLMVIIITKENLNSLRFKILIFLLGFFIIVFSETTLRFVTDSFERNVILLLLPIFGFFVLRQIMISKINSGFNKLKNENLY